MTTYLLQPAHVPTPYQSPSNVQPGPTPQPRSRPPNNPNYFPELPELPSVPSDLILPSVPNTNTNTSTDANAPDEIDFEDLNRRFEELKKKK